MRKDSPDVISLISKSFPLIFSLTSYMVVIAFNRQTASANRFAAEIISPEIPHCDDPTLHCYAICIPRKFFEERYRLYVPDIPVFNRKKFEICSDILKYMNMFAFEASKNMQNSDITLNAHAELITHWIIRSILGESMICVLFPMIILLQKPSIIWNIILASR